MKSEKTTPLTPELKARLHELDVRRQELLKQFKSLEADFEFVFATLQLEAVHEVNKAMEEEGMTQAELAKRIGCSRQNVHRLLSDEANFKLEMLAKLAVALGRDVSVKLIRKNEQVEVRPAGASTERYRRTSAASSVAVVQEAPPDGSWREDRDSRPGKRNWSVVVSEEEEVRGAVRKAKGAAARRPRKSADASVHVKTKTAVGKGKKGR